MPFEMLVGMFSHARMTTLAIVQLLPLNEVFMGNVCTSHMLGSILLLFDRDVGLLE